VEEVLQLFAESAHQKGIELVCQVEDDVPLALQGDSGRLRQVLANIIGNAIKFTERGEVFLRVSALGKVEDREFVGFEIRDTGIGIAPEAMGHIFQSFSQADGTTTRKYGGTGLGLAISKSLVELMGGEITMVSASGSGSTFRFTLPMKIAAELSGTALVCRDELRDISILVVDDNVTSRDTLHEQLRSWGMRVESAASARDALEMLRKASAAGDPFQVALLDMAMPGMSGLELAQAVRTDRAIASLPLIIMTSLGGDFSPETPSKDDVSAFLTKPVRRSRLYGCLTAVTRSESTVLSPRQPERGELQEADLLAGTRVLLVEDNPVNREVAQQMLHILGCHVKAASNGQEAIDALEADSYDLVLMDCQMPVLDGYEATQIVREREAQAAKNGQSQGARRTPIVAITANAMQGDRDRSLAAGMDDYLSKPFNLKGLLAVLERQLPSKAVSDQPMAHSDDSPRSVDGNPSILPLIARDASSREAAQEPVRDLSRGDPAALHIADKLEGKGPNDRGHGRTSPFDDKVIGGPAPLETGLLDRLSLLESIDCEVLESLRAIRLDGQPSPLQKIIERFLETSPHDMETIRQAILSLDAPSMQKATHSFISSCGWLGAKRLVELCRELQNMGTNGDTRDVTPLLTVLAAEYEKVREVLLVESKRSQ
jgi:CheY-like chemotaxis protein/HPt (histidine-containing phosphotransfer) domain-containing protein